MTSVATKRPRPCVQCSSPNYSDHSDRCSQCRQAIPALPDRTLILLDAPEQPLSVTTAALRLSSTQTRRLIRQAYGVSWRRLVCTSAGVSVADVATAFGVSTTQICRLIRDAGLPARQINRHLSINPNDLYDWLAAGHALRSWPDATGEWAGHLRDLRSDLTAQYIRGRNIPAWIGISDDAMTRYKLHHDFPPPVFRFGRDGAWYDRTAVLTWCAAHPQQVPQHRPPQGVVLRSGLIAALGVSHDSFTIWQQQIGLLPVWVGYRRQFGYAATDVWTALDQTPSRWTTAARRLLEDALCQ